MTNGVTKEIFLNAVECRTLGWFLRSSDDSEALGLADRFRMMQGSEIGRLARSLYPDGVMIAPGPQARDETARLMADPQTRVLFEATFRVGACTAKADILVRSGGGWKVIEVKLGLEDTDRMADLIADLAYTVVAARKSGVRIPEASLVLQSRNYRKGMDTTRLFAEVDQTAAVDQLAPAFEQVWNEIERETGAATRPAPLLTKACKSCAFFATACHGKGVTHPVFEIHRLGEKKLADLALRGILAIDQLPGGFKLTENQARVVQVVKSGKPFVGPIRQELAGVTWPASYLDFESMQTAIPLYADLAPFTQVPTQYSIHRCAVPGKMTDHLDYVADPSRDCQRELAEKLLRDLGANGSVVVYSSFEKTRIRALATRFPDLTAQFGAIESRLFDLLSVVTNTYYHPDFHGSCSIKNVLPVLVPGLSYDGMEIGDGDAASAAFALIAMGKYADDESGRLLDLLRAYCKQDTLAMVKLHEALLAV